MDVVRTQCCGPSLPKLQRASNRMMLRKSHFRLGSSLKAEECHQGLAKNLSTISEIG